MTKEAEDIETYLKEVIEHFEKEDSTVRERQIQTWKRLKLFWDGFSHLWYSEVAHDWRIADESGATNDQAYYDKPVNIFRAYLESIIAALSVLVPPIKCYPDDADNALDLSTARAGDKLAQLIYRHNDVTLLWIHALFIFITEGMIACYNYSKADEKYGTYKENKYEDITEQHEYSSCPTCGHQFDDRVMADDEIPNQLGLEQEECPVCLIPVIPILKQEPVETTTIVETIEKAKVRQRIEVYGGLYVKIPIYAKKQEDCLYLIYSYETHYAHVRARYKDDDDLLDKLNTGRNTDEYGSDARTSSQYRGERPDNNVTVRNAWLRPEAFYVLEKDKCDKLLKEYPDGVKVVLANEHFAEAVSEKLDDHWTLTHNPLSDYIHFDPIGLLLTSVQEITNDLISLVLQTIEHGIPQTFADPNTLNFNAYRASEVAPGMISPATPKSGKSMGDSFYEVRTATLSGEVLPFFQQVQSLGQVASGALPSLFGGQMEGSKTASEYSMSRSQALQRQQNTWKMLIIWWKAIFTKVIPQQIKDIQEDERDVQKDKSGGFINVFIRKAELEGKIGKVELEANENLPMTWLQTKDVIMKLFENMNPAIQSLLTTPENMPFLYDAIGLVDFEIPGEDDRNKQYEEIQQLINSDPIEEPPDPMMMQQAQMQGQELPPIEKPSVEIDMEFDNHNIHFECCRKWIVSEVGRGCKTENEPGYRNVLLHAMQHKQQIMMAMMQQQQAGAPNAENPPEDTEAPITGEPNVG